VRYKPNKTAIALEYGQNPVPILTAKGDGADAEAIIAEAKKKGIYIAEDPHLVSLLSDLKLNDEIPESLYVTVAIILSWAYWLKDIEPVKRD
jgi:flagellar biosynthesis protein|tara:strand:+ start:320 stop:595 length:276 start_codon:yes stop_codon:yes gene_type:complete